MILTISEVRGLAGHGGHDWMACIAPSWPRENGSDEPFSYARNSGHYRPL